MAHWYLCVLVGGRRRDGTFTHTSRVKCAANDYQHSPAVRSHSKQNDKFISSRAQLTVAVKSKINLQVELQDTSNFIHNNQYVVSTHLTTAATELQS